MRAPSPLLPSELLRTWEWGAGRHHLERGLLPLHAVRSENDEDDPADLPLGERNARLIALRIVTLGPILQACTTCPACGAVLELRVDTRELLVDGDAQGEYVVDEAGWRVWHRLPTTRDLIAVAGEPSIDAARRTLLRRCLLGVEHDGRAEPDDLVPDNIVAAVSASIEAADPLAEITVAMSCTDCGGACPAVLDVGRFLWAELDGAARRLLHDVHVLAAAYGWTERDVLALSAVRRAAYLGLVGGG